MLLPNINIFLNTKYSFFFVILIIIYYFFVFCLLLYVPCLLKILELNFHLFIIFGFIGLVMLLDNYIIFIENILKEFIYLFPLLFLIVYCLKLCYYKKYRILLNFIFFKLIFLVIYIFSDQMFFNNIVNFLVKTHIFDKLGGSVLFCEDSPYKTDVILALGFLGIFFSVFFYQYHVDLKKSKELYNISPSLPRVHIPIPSNSSNISIPSNSSNIPIPSTNISAITLAILKNKNYKNFMLDDRYRPLACIPKFVLNITFDMDKSEIERESYRMLNNSLKK